MTPKKRNVFLDTSVILGGGMNFLSRTAKAANLYVTDIVLQELDGKKNAEGKAGFNAREFYRQFNTAKVEELHELPDGQKLDRRDVLQQMTLPDGLVLHTIHRTPYKTRDINDSKIIEVAKDYKGTLSTIDMAQSVRARSVGCDTWVVKMEEEEKKSSIAGLIFFFLMFLIFFIIVVLGLKLSTLEMIYLGIAWFGIFFALLIGGYISGRNKDIWTLNGRSKNRRSEDDEMGNVFDMDSSSTESPYTDPSYMGASWSYYD